VLSLLEAEELDRSCLAAGWSPKVLLAHIAFWDDYQTRRMEAALQGTSAVHGFPRPLEDNDQRATADESRDWNEIATEADRNRQRMIDFARSLRDDQLISYPEGTRTLDLPKQLAHMARHVRDHAAEIVPYCGSLERWGRAGLRRFLDQQHKNFLDSIGSLSEETVTAVPVCGVWTVRDVIVHVIRWEEYALQVLRQWPNVAPASIARWLDGGNRDEINAILQAEMAHLDMIGVLDAAATVQRRLLTAFDKISDGELQRQGDFGFGMTGTLSSFLYDTARHTAVHAAEIWEARVNGELKKA
jgi:uncharacterized damage-inducible protein DinB